MTTEISCGRILLLQSRSSWKVGALSWPPSPGRVSRVVPSDAVRTVLRVCVVWTVSWVLLDGTSSDPVWHAELSLEGGACEL